MNFITLNINKIMPQKSNATTNTTENEEQRELAKHNLQVLHQSHKNGTRYRIRRGLYNGRKVAVIVEARTFLDKLFSYIPSSSSLKERFSAPLKSFIGKDTEIGDLTVNYLSYGKAIPNVSTTEASDLYTPTNVYNPWHDLPKTLNKEKYNATGVALEADAEIERPYTSPPSTQVTFFNEDARSEKLSNLYVRDDERALAFVELPGIVHTVSCPEVFFQARKFYNKPTIREAILKAKTALEARNIAENELSSESQIDDTASSEDMDIQLMLKIVRTRAQQHLNFRNALRDTGDKLIFNITPNDKKWGCTKITNHYGTVTGYEGENLLARIFMMVRSEIDNNKMIPREVLEAVQRDRGIN